MRLLLEIHDGQVRRRFDLTEENYILGRGSSCDLVLGQNSVSRIHAALVFYGRQYHIEDRGGRNGVFVNGVKTASAALRSGDRIQLSLSTNLLYIEEDDELAVMNAIIANLEKKSSDEELTRIEKVTERVISCDKLDDIMKMALQEAISFVGADRGFLALAEDGEILNSKRFVTYNLPTEREGFRNFISSSIVERAIDGCQKVIVTNTAEKESSCTTSVFNLQLRAVMCFPLRIANRLIGVLYVDSGNALDPFSSRHQFFFRLLADNTAIAIENAKLVEQLEERVRESEARYEKLVELSPDSIFLVVEGKIVFANAAAVDLLETDSREELVGKQLTDILQDGKKEEFLLASRKGSQDTAVYSCNGGRRDVEIVAASLESEGIGALLLVARDVTARRKIDAELQRAEKLQSLSTMAGGLAHDFNNLLAAIIGNVSVAAEMLSNKGEETILSRLKECEDACERASTLTQQLLTFSSGGAPIKTKVALESLLQGMVRFALSGTKVKAAFSFPDSLSQVEVDKAQLTQAISSVVANAVEAMPNGGRLWVQGRNIEVAADSHLALPAGRYISIDITDEGPGISDYELKRIFDPFYSTKKDASGLGLATTYSIAKRHGGTVVARRGSQGGSTFSIVLPALIEVRREADHEMRHERYNGRVLVMDDEKAIGSMARAMVSTMGLSADIAVDGNEAIDLYEKALDRNEPYTAVIMDLTVPGGMGGAEAIRHLRQIDPAIRAIVSSGYSTDAVMANFREHGFIGVLEKPYGLRKLQAVLGAVITGKVA